MKIYTSYFTNLKKLPPEITTISICGKAPDWYRGIQYKKLAPKYEFFMEWKKNHDNDYYIQHFKDEVLNVLDREVIIQKLSELSNEKDVALICYEKPNDFCHRHLVAEWLSTNDFKVEERI